MHGVTDRALRRAYARCRRMQLRHDPTFFAATARLPRDVSDGLVVCQVESTAREDLATVIFRRR